MLNEWEEAQALLAKQLQKVGASISRDEPLSQTYCIKYQSELGGHWLTSSLRDFRLKKRMEHYCHIFQKRSRTASPQFLFREEAELTALSTPFSLNSLGLEGKKRSYGSSLSSPRPKSGE